MKKLLILLTLTVSLNCFSQLQLIPLKATDAIANQHTKDDFNKLVDGDISTRYTVWSPQVAPYRIIYDLANYDNCIIKQLKFYVNTGNLSQLKYIIRDANGLEKVLYSYPGGAWIQNYQTVDINNSIAARYFIIESAGYDDFPDELQVYGSYTLHTWPPVNRQATPLRDLFGVVIKPWDDGFQLFPEKLPSLLGLKISRVRLYNDYQLNHFSDGSWNMNQQDGWRQIDNMQILKSNGVSTQMCYLSFPYEPFPTGDSIRQDPATYLQLAKDIYDFGVSNKANGEYFKTIEVGNEMNRWYAFNFDEYMDGYALAAMMSICYDGHHGKFANVGLKASGSTADVSICGLAEGEPYLLYQIMEWSARYRGYRADGTIDLPFDIYSFHCYSSIEGQRQGVAGGVAPEFAMVEPMRRLNEIRNRYFPWLKIHIGEWGWDISENSPLNAPAFGPYTANQTSAIWSIRAIVWMAAKGIDRSSYYRIEQDYDALSDGSYLPFATMALIRAYGTGIKQPDGSYLGLDLRRTPTGDYFRQLSLLLSDGWVFDSQVSSSPVVLRFKKGSQQLFALWQVETMTVIDRPQFTENKGTFTIASSGTLYRFADDGSGVMSSEPFSGGNVQTSSKPVFVIINPVNSPLPVRFISFTAQKQATTVFLQWQVDGAKKFEVERSDNGVSFSPIAKLTNYSMYDLSPLPGFNFYRLKMIEENGSFSYSPIVRVQFSFVQLTASVFDAIGRKLRKATINNITQFEEALKHDHALSPGVYFIQYTDNKNLFFNTKIQRP